MAYDSQNFEGADDKPTHIKASLLGNNLSITIVDGTLGLGLGLWQGPNSNHKHSQPQCQTQKPTTTSKAKPNAKPKTQTRDHTRGETEAIHATAVSSAKRF